MANLNVKTIEKIIREAKPGAYAYGESGLYLKIGQSGAPSWLCRYQIAGKRRSMGLGAHSTTALSAAREKAAAAQKLIAAGIDPLETKQAVEAPPTESTFRQVAKAYIDGHRAAWKNLKHGDQWTNTLATYAEPVIGDLDVARVTTEHVLEILQPIWATKTETASRVRNRIELVLSYARAKKLREGENPAAWRGHLDAILAKPNKLKAVRHHPALPFNQMPEFMKALRACNGSGPRALEFAILTAARSGEVRLAVWSEIDIDAKLWTIPAARMKAGREHRVALSTAAISLLEKLPRSEFTEHLFPGDRDRRPVSDMTLTAVIRRQNEDAPKWIDPKNGASVVPHGFRSTFRDWAAEATHHAGDLVEMALAHAIGSAVEAAYRRGDMFEKRLALMEDWAAHCQ